jgi:rfaE bifunctional protein nucleotidyltransferase chain/domain
VFTNGVFDLLHPGHVELLEAARCEGDLLIVGVNTDASARRLDKGPGRPVSHERARARVVAGLAAVDCVVLFDEDTPLELIRALEPDVLVKGADYSRDRIVGADWVEARGGRVVRVPVVPGFSTTALVERLRAPS